MPAASRFVIGAGGIPPDALTAGEPIIAIGRSLTDTCKEVDGDLVRRTVPRETLMDLCGPWLVSRRALVGALEAAAGPGVEDPLQLFLGPGRRIRVFAQS